MNLRPNQYFPVYIDVSPQDIQELTNTQWDTLRILFLPDTNQLAISSGYGNTHTSMVYALRQHFKIKRITTDDSILYFEHGRAYINDTCYGLGEKISASNWHKVFNNPAHVDLLKCLSEERGLILS